MKKVEYTTQTGRKVLVEIVEKQEIGHEEMSGQPIEKDCWELNVELDGQYKIFSRLATAKYQGQEVNVLDCGSVKIMVPQEVYPAVKELVDAYLTEMRRRLHASYAADKAYDDHCKAMRRAMGE